MTDYTVVVTELQMARSAYRKVKKDVAADVRSEFEVAILKEIGTRTKAAEAEFATRIQAAVASGVPQSIIRKEVLRTNDWDTWVHWRDLAGVDPERVTRDNAREAKLLADRPYRWSDDFTEVTWLRDLKNKELAKPIRVAVDFNHLHFPDVHPEDKDFAITTFGSLTKFFESVVPVIQEKHSKAPEEF